MAKRSPESMERNRAYNRWYWRAHKERLKKWRKKHNAKPGVMEKRLARGREYCRQRQAHRNEVKRKLYASDPGGRIHKKAAAYQRKRARIARDTLADSYVVRLFIRNGILKATDVPASLIAAKRAQLMIHRLTNRKEKP